MLSRVCTARAIIKIVLADNREIDIKSKVVGTVDEVNYVTNVKISRSLSASSNNPIGVPCSTNGSITLRTEDQSLIPENSESPYYGYMNNKAVVYINLVDEESTEASPLPFGIYYVDNWYSDISSGKTTEVIIEFTGIMSHLNKSTAPLMNIERNVNFKDYLVDLVKMWNDQAEPRYKLTVNRDKLTFGPFITMPYSDIDADNFGGLLTILSQSTLTNIYISNENEVLTDYCFDDKESQSVTTISDCDNAFDYSVGDGLLVKYKGVKVNYPSIVVNKPAEVSNLAGQTIVANKETDISNIDVGGKLFKLNYVDIKCEDGEAFDVVSFSYNKKYVNLKIRNNKPEDKSVDISVYGQTLNSGTRSINRGTEPILEVTNSLLGGSSINRFADNLNDVIRERGNQITVSGYFNPRINLGDIVTVDLKAINKSGVYKVHSIDTTLDNSIQTSLTLYTMNKADRV